MSSIRTALIMHLITTAWLLVNGVAHTAQVLWKARAGTLAHGSADIEGLMAIGAGLLMAGAAYTYSAGGLLRGGPPVLWPAFLSCGLLGAVIAGIARRYGFMFLSGTIFFALLHLALLTATAVRLRAG